MAELPQERATRGNLVLRRLLGYLQPYWKQLLLVLALTILSAATQAIGPYLIGRAIDSAIGQRRWEGGGMWGIVSSAGIGGSGANRGLDGGHGFVHVPCHPPAK